MFLLVGGVGVIGVGWDGGVMVQNIVNIRIVLPNSFAEYVRTCEIIICYCS